MLGRKTGFMVRGLGLGIAALGLAVYVAGPAQAEDPVHNSRPARPERPHVKPAVHEHAPHKPPPSFAPLRQDQPAHKPHPVLQPGPVLTDMVHVRSPHVTHLVAPVVVVRPERPVRKAHIIVHSEKIVEKQPIVVTKRQPARPSRPAKISGGVEVSTVPPSVKAQ
jgi:hypothetical protein